MLFGALALEGEEGKREGILFLFKGPTPKLHALLSLLKTESHKAIFLQGQPKIHSLLSFVSQNGHFRVSVNSDGSLKSLNIYI